jgi:hypothetical protein
MSRLRWVTVMFWEGKNERYKILFRDGQDAWATGEELDRAIAFKSTYPDLLQLQASYEEWDYHAVQAKLITYGLYCAKHVGPPSVTKATATASLNGRDVYPQRFASDKQSASSDKTTGTAAPRELPGRDIAPVTTQPSLWSAGNPFIFKGNPYAFRPRPAKCGEIEDENDEFFRPEAHKPSSPSHRSDDPVVIDSNASSTQALAPVPPTDPTTSMAAQAMISLGAAVMAEVVPPTADPKLIAPTNEMKINALGAATDWYRAGGSGIRRPCCLRGGCGLCCGAT